MSPHRPAVIALAGRRIDPDAEASRFPLAAVPLVRQRIADLLRDENAAALACSAACGADLIALEEAGRLGLHRRVVLPFAPERFRETSVTDRPGDWGPIFDRVIAAAAGAGDLVVMDAGSGDAAYALANAAIIAAAQALADDAAAPLRPIGVIVWEGAAREGTDATADFRSLAEAAGFEGRSVSTR